LNWNDLQQIFSKAAGRNFGWFFQQWIDRPGAPTVTIENIMVRQDPAGKGSFTVTGMVRQDEPVFNLRLPIHLDLQEGPAYETILNVDQPAQAFSFDLQRLPKTLVIDPNHHLLLRFQREHLPPMLNKWETDTRRLLIRPQTFSEGEEQSFETLFQRLEGQPGIGIIQTDNPEIAEPASYLVIGSSARRLLESDSFKNCHTHINGESMQVSIKDQKFDSPETAFLISCPHPQDAKRTVTLFFGLSPEAVRPVSRLLFFYGWDSYLVFKEGNVIARGMFQPVHSARRFMISIQQ
jgi:aminopeptidase N